MSNPLAPEHLIEHVKDADHFVVPRAFTADGTGVIKLPQPLALEKPIVLVSTSDPKINGLVEPVTLKLTKFMVLEVVAALLIAVIFIRLAQKMSSGRPVRGRIANFFEAMLVFIRDEVARPAIGGHDADKFLPFVWNIFFFVLFCNLLGMVPWAGSATGALGTTLALAFITFAMVVGAGSIKLGPIGFWKALVPHIDLPWLIWLPLAFMIFVIEVAGLLIKHTILGVRLLANMLAGHLVLAVLMAFIAAAWTSVAVWGVAPASILASVALSMLELFVAFLQAYLFAFLAALFIGMAVHPH